MELLEWANKFFLNFKMQLDFCSISLYKRGGSEFTRYVLGVIDDILRNEFTLRTEREYYRIDTIGWTDRKNEVVGDSVKYGLNPHLWDLQVAVEHENDPHDWTDELIKLSHIRCPLKIVIGYNHFNLRSSDIKKLSTAIGWMKKTNAYSENSRDVFLFIIGNANIPSTKTEYDSFDYRGYIFFNNNLHEIQSIT